MADGTNGKANGHSNGHSNGKQAKQVPRKPGGQFAAGVCGNPKGRPRSRGVAKTRSAGVALDRAVELAGQIDQHQVDAWLTKLNLPPELVAAIKAEDGVTTWLTRCALEQRTDVLTMFRARIPREVKLDASEDFKSLMGDSWRKQLRLEELLAEVIDVDAEVTDPVEMRARDEKAAAAALRLLNLENEDDAESA